jgi:hypothetical protein
MSEADNCFPHKDTLELPTTAKTLCLTRGYGIPVFIFQTGVAPEKTINLFQPF